MIFVVKGILWYSLLINLLDDETMILTNFEHPSKAPSPISVVERNVICVSDEHPEKA